MKIVSGGQTGVDRAALDAALQMGIDAGGWCPEGRLAEDGTIPDKYPVEELTKSGYRQRTKQNVIDSDGTIIIFFCQPTGGTKLTIDFCIKAKQPYELIDAEKFTIEQASEKIIHFIGQHNISTLNVAGPRASGDSRAYGYARELILHVLHNMSNSEHWNHIYSTRATDQVGWYTPHLETSLEWIQALNLNSDDAIIDVGGGASTLVDDLLANGQGDITVLDLSKHAINHSRQRLGDRSDRITWLVGDVTEIELPNQQYHLWHDRAVFHFLVTPEQQQKYRQSLLKALQPDGLVLVGTFSVDGPPQCSGLPVQRYTVESLSEFYGSEFKLLRHQYEVHVTPSQFKQAYVYCLFQRVT